MNGKQGIKMYFNEREKIHVFCSFSNGQPPVTIRLLEVGGQVSNSSNATKGRIELFFQAYLCKDVWHSVRCEGPSSELNRSVNILVKCEYSFFLRAKLKTVFNEPCTLSIRYVKMYLFNNIFTLHIIL